MLGSENVELNDPVSSQVACSIFSSSTSPDHGCKVVLRNVNFVN
jgi:hypothetical protein